MTPDDAIAERRDEIMATAKAAARDAMPRQRPRPSRPRPWWRRGSAYLAIVAAAVVVACVMALGWIALDARGEAQNATAAASANRDGLAEANARILALGGTPVPTPSAGADGRPGANGPTGATGARGADGRGITKTRIVSGNLIVDYDNGTSENVGRVAGSTGATGRGIAGVAIADTRLVVTYSDGRAVDVGRVVGQSGANGSTGATGVSGAPGRSGNDGVSVVSLAATDGRLIARYDDGRTEDVGPLPPGPTGPQGDTGPRGAAGRGIASVDCTGLGVDRLQITYDDGTTQDVACDLASPTDTTTAPSTPSTPGATDSP